MRRKVLIVLALLLLAGVGLEIYGSCTYVRPMQNQKRYSMNPLTRQVFDLDYREVEYIRVLNKNDRYLEWLRISMQENRIRVGGLWLYGLPSFHKTCMNDL